MSSGTRATLIANRYRLGEKLGAGGMGTVYRAFDRLSGQEVALKQMALPSREPDSTSYSDTDSLRVALSNEFRILATIRHPNVIPVMDYGFAHDQIPYFTMALLDRPQTISQYAEGKSAQEKVRVLTDMLQALAYLHRQQIVHRDLKPGNVLVTEDGTVRVLDFGLSMAIRSSRQRSDQTAGTLAYMAPELFGDEPTSAASDLYAVGVIAYELFKGQRPFEHKNVAGLMSMILSQLPDLGGIDERAAPVIGRLLHKAANERYASAEAAIEALAEAMDQALPGESVGLRESFLQAAHFVGREAEFNQLREALGQVVLPKEEGAAGSAWLVGGESGVGKSRLLDEVRVRALVQGVMVLRGQAVAEGGVAYQLWREPLRRLILTSSLDDTDATILKEVVPDIGDLLERAVPDAPPMSGRGGQRRLIGAIISMFRQQRQPMLLLLEDLHWADESLEVLKSLAGTVQALSLLIIGTYRDDERPTLPDELRGIQTIKLERLSTESVKALSAAMLGDAGTHADVIDFLQRETEGNAFFLVEVVRALAEEAGRLSAIGQKALPQSVFAGGVQQVIQRRLKRVPDSARPMLKLAAVAGRELDFSVIEAAARPEPFNLDEWVTICVNAAVVDIQDGRWRFSHDKLREAVLHDLPDEERRFLHQQTAEAIESVYPDRQAQATVLAMHWRAAGSIERELPYLQLAMKAAQRINSHRDMISCGERLLDILPATEEEEAARTRLSMSSSYQLLSQFDKAEAMAEAALECGQRTANPAIIARALQVKAGGLLDQGHLDDARQYIEQALAYQAQVDDATVLGRIHLTTGSIQLMLGHLDTAIDHYQQAHDYYQDIEPASAAGSLMNMGVAFERQEKISAALANYEKALSTFRKLGDRYGQGLTLANVGLALRKLGEFESEKEHLNHYLRIAREIGSPMHESMAYSNLATHSRDAGDFGQAHVYWEQVRVLRERYGPNYYTPVDLYNEGLLWLNDNDEEAGIRLLETAIAEGEKVQDGRAANLARARLAQIHLEKGHLEQAADLIQLLRQQDPDERATQWNYGLVLARQGQYDEARVEIEAALQDIEAKLALTPELWTEKFERAHALAVLTLISSDSARDGFFQQAMAAYQNVCNQISLRGVRLYESAALKVLEPLDTEGVLQVFRSILNA